MPDDTRELMALLDAALTHTLTNPATRALRQSFEAIKRRHAHDEASATHIEVGSILSRRTHQGMVELTLNREKTQMDLDKAREVLQMLSNAIEAAVSDSLIYGFLVGRVGMSPENASLVLLDFRELRQGSRDTVYPS